MEYKDVKERLDAYDSDDTNTNAKGDWMTGYIVAMLNADIITESELTKLIQDYVIINK